MQLKALQQGGSEAQAAPEMGALPGRGASAAAGVAPRTPAAMLDVGGNGTAGQLLLRHQQGDGPLQQVPDVFELHSRRQQRPAAMGHPPAGRAVQQQKQQRRHQHVMGRGTAVAMLQDSCGAADGAAAMPPAALSREAACLGAQLVAGCPRTPLCRPVLLVSQDLAELPLPTVLPATRPPCNLCVHDPRTSPSHAPFTPTLLPSPLFSHRVRRRAGTGTAPRTW